MFWIAIVTLVSFTGVGLFVRTYRRDERRHQVWAAPQVRPWAGHTTWDAHPPPTVREDDPRHPNYTGGKY